MNDMYRIGVIKEAFRQKNRRVFLAAPVPFWRKERNYYLAFLIITVLWFGFTGLASAAGGTVRYITECVPSGNLTATAPCVRIGTVGYKPASKMVSAYIIDPAYQAAYEDWIANQISVDSLVASKVTIDWLVANKPAIQNVLNNQSISVAATFDPTLAGQFFAWGFTGLMLVGVAAWGAGSILGFINRVMG